MGCNVNGKIMDASNKCTVWIRKSSIIKCIDHGSIWRQNIKVGLVADFNCSKVVGDVCMQR